MRPKLGTVFPPSSGSRHDRNRNNHLPSPSKRTKSRSQNLFPQTGRASRRRIHGSRPSNAWHVRPLWNEADTNYLYTIYISPFSFNVLLMLPQTRLQLIPVKKILLITCAKISEGGWADAAASYVLEVKHSAPYTDIFGTPQAGAIRAFT
jgi:hypothetical protein